MTDTISFQRPAKRGLVSIVIPTCNGARFIADALASVGQQTYSNWETLIVEDGSNDGTSQIVNEFAAKHRWHRVDYTRNERNCGPSHTRNVAFRKARGEFIALLDADDRWFPDHLQVSVDTLTKNGAEVAYSSAIMVEDRSDLLLGVWGPMAHDLATFPSSLFTRNFITPSATVMRRQVLADVGPWETSLRYCEDLSYWFRCLRAGKSFQYVPGCHCLYRKNHDGAATNRRCETLETVAVVSERYLNLPGIERDQCQRYVAKSYRLAADIHRQANRARDPSADASRVGPLLLHAWRLRRTHIDWLLKGAALSIGNFFRRGKRSEVQPKPPAHLDQSQPKFRTAA